MIYIHLTDKCISYMCIFYFIIYNIININPKILVPQFIWKYRFQFLVNNWGFLNLWQLALRIMTWEKEDPTTVHCYKTLENSIE